MKLMESKLNREMEVDCWRLVCASTQNSVIDQVYELLRIPVWNSIHVLVKNSIERDLR